MTTSEAALRRAQVPYQPPRIVTDESVSNALEWMRENAKHMGECRRKLLNAESLVKRTRAIVMREHSNLPIGAQQREAAADKRVADAEEDEAFWAGEWEKIRAERDYHAAIIEAWRTESSTLRSMKL